MQHYIAKDYHYFSLEPSSRLEWLEVMQHHGMNTRVMDWSESSIHSLIFALGNFFEMPDQNKDGRRLASPCVWVMDPGGLNRETFQIISQDGKLCVELLEGLDFSPLENDKIQENVESGNSADILLFDKNILCRIYPEGTKTAAALCCASVSF